MVNYLIIQNFTANSLSFLGLNSNYLNNTVEISSLIKQFHEEILKYMIDSEATLSPEQKMSIKRQIISTKFKNPSLVNWKNPEADVNELVHPLVADAAIPLKHLVEQCVRTDTRAEHYATCQYCRNCDDKFSHFLLII